MLKLNRISEDRAREDADATRNLLQRVLARPIPQNDQGLQALHESAGRVSLKLGLLGYALESAADSVRQLFQDAAAHLAPALALRRPPDADTHRGPWEAEEWLDVVACFGNDAGRRAVAKLEPWQYRNPSHPEHDALAGYLRILLPQLGGEPVDTSGLREVIEACGAANTAKESRLFLLPAASGLLAAESHNEDDWNYALARILSAHGREARSGDLQLLPSGFISFRALMLANLGRARGMVCRATSEYLPLFLLREAK